MKKYDYIFITNVPAFYKVNLFNKLAKNCSLKVIFISRTSKMREKDFYDYTHHFESEYICEQDFESRNPLSTLIEVYKSISGVRFKTLVFPGWEIKELMLLSLIKKRKSNAVVIESSINETITHGYAWILKKIYLKKMGTAFPAGKLQKAILDKMNFTGNVIVTHGVGIPNYYKTVKNSVSAEGSNNQLNYLYVGRLSPEKNMLSLVKVFNERKEHLTIVGSGPEEEKLRQAAGTNIRFLGYIDNKKLEGVYQSADVFILPSKAEPWGLVIDEALSFGLPVIVSNKVGCIDDLVSSDNGLIFDLDEPQSLVKCMNKMSEQYSYFSGNTKKIDMHVIYQKQVDSYLTLKSHNET